MSKKNQLILVFGLGTSDNYIALLDLRPKLTGCLLYTLFILVDSF